MDRRFLSSVVVGLLFMLGILGVVGAAGPSCRDGRCRLVPGLGSSSASKGSPVVSPPVPSSDSSVVGGFQSVAEARALALAKRGRFGLSHELSEAPSIPSGLGEGIGYSSDGLNVPTCVLRGKVVADAVAAGADGFFYRVRFFQDDGVAMGSDGGGRSFRPVRRILFGRRR